MNLKNMLNAQQLNEKKSQIKKIFFYRICGTGMGAAACLLKEAGFDVEGGDSSFSPPMSTYLDTTGIPCHDLSLVDSDFLKKYDLIIVGNSLGGKSEMARMIEESGVYFASFPSVLGGFVLNKKNVVGIAGTHGKTTTTYFLTQMLESLGHDTGYLVGGVIDGRAPSRLGKSDYFVIESDEYDSAYFEKISKFRLYELDHMILTSLEFDHADIFASVEDIEKEFAVVLPHLKGHTIVNNTYESIKRLDKTLKHAPWIWYGTSEVGGPIIKRNDDKGSEFSVILNNSKVDFKTNVIGEHNLLNITSCILFLHAEGFSVDKIQKATQELGMVKRRQELRGSYRGALVIDDFAHHPRAIDLTVNAIRRAYPTRKIVTVFEPVSATARSSCFQTEFAQTLGLSDEVIIAQNPMQTTAKKFGNLDCDQLASDINKMGKNASCVKSLEALRKAIDLKANANNLLLILSNRTCIGLWESDFADEIV